MEARRASREIRKWRAFRRFPFLSGRSLLNALVLLMVIAGKAFPAMAQGSETSKNPAKVRLLRDTTRSLPATKTAARTLWVGVLFELEPGWHVYWKNPGDSGEPPNITWELPPGFRMGEIRWPKPTLLRNATIVDYGYERSLLLMAPLEAPETLKAGENRRIAAKVKYIVCEKICVPGKVDLTLDLSAADSGAAKIFAEARKQWPSRLPASWKVSVASAKDAFTLSVIGEVDGEGARFFPEQESVVENAAEQREKSSGAGFTLKLRKSEQLTSDPRVLKGLLLLRDGRAFEIAASVWPAP